MFYIHQKSLILLKKISDNTITLYYSKFEKHIFHIQQKNLSKYLYLKYLKYLKYYYNTNF